MDMQDKFCYGISLEEKCLLQNCNLQLYASCNEH
jgi:hypothetical protein